MVQYDIVDPVTGGVRDTSAPSDCISVLVYARDRLRTFQVRLGLPVMTKRRRPADEGRFRRWFKRNRSDLRFLLVFGLLMGIYYLLTVTPLIRDGFFPTYLEWNAGVSGSVLRLFGEDVTVVGQEMTAAGGESIHIERGCDAVEPSALFVAAVMASPVPFLSRLSAAVGGTLILMVINLARVISLFLVRVYAPGAFKIMHLDVWQALFIFLAIALWALWASRHAQKRRRKDHASA